MLRCARLCTAARWRSTPATGRGCTPRCSDPSARRRSSLPTAGRSRSPYWTYVISDLSGRFRVIAYDLRGHGHSQPAADGDYAIARFGEDLEAVLEASLAAGERAVVVGHSLGAMSIAAWAEHTTSSVGSSAVALLNTGVGDLIAESLLIPVPRVAQAAQPYPPLIQLPRVPRAPPSRLDTAQPRVDPLRRVRADRVARAGRVLRTHAGRLPSRRARRRGDRLVRARAPPRGAAADRTGNRAGRGRTTD